MKIDLKQPDQRRALRSIAQAFVVLALLALTWFNIHRLDQLGVRYILGWAMTIILVGTLGYIMENGLRSVKWKGWGLEGEATNEGPTPVTVVNPPSDPVPVESKESMH